jgi:hypothetical protein
MNRAQKIARYSLSVLFPVFLLSLAMTYWIGSTCGWHKSVLGLSFLGLSCIAGFGPLIFRKDKTQTVQRDERDTLIELRALYAGYSACYCYFLTVAMTLLFTHDLHEAVQVIWLLPLFIGGYVITELVHSIAILSQYGWKSPGRIQDE